MQCGAKPGDRQGREDFKLDIDAAVKARLGKDDVPSLTSIPAALEAAYGSLDSDAAIRPTGVKLGD